MHHNTKNPPPVLNRGELHFSRYHLVFVVIITTSASNHHCFSIVTGGSRHILQGHLLTVQYATLKRNSHYLVPAFFSPTKSSLKDSDNGTTSWSSDFSYIALIVKHFRRIVKLIYYEFCCQKYISFLLVYLSSEYLRLLFLKLTLLH